MPEAMTVAALLRVFGQNTTRQELTNFRSNVKDAGKDAERAGKSMRESFTGAAKSISALGVLTSGLVAGGIATLGASLIKTAMDAGTSSENFFRFQDAAFELRRTLGELLIKVLDPILGVLSVMARGLSNVINAIELVVWRNWETVLEGIRSGLGLMDRVFGGLLSTLGLFNLGVKDTSRAGDLMRAVWNPIGRDFGRIGDALKEIGDNIDPLLKLLELTPLSGPLKIIAEAIKQIKENLFSKEEGEGLSSVLAAGVPGLREIELLASALEIIAKALKSINEGSLPAFLGGGGNGDGGTGVSGDLPLFGPGGGLLPGGGVATGPGGVAVGPLMGIGGGMTTESEKIKSIWESTWDWVREKWNDFWMWFSEDGWPAFRDFWMDGWAAVSNWAKEIWSLVKENAMSLWGEVSDWWNDTAWPEFLDAWTTGWDKIATLAEDAWNTVKETAQQVWPEIRDLILGIVQSVIDKINRFIQLWNKMEFRTPEIRFSAFGREFRVRSRTFGTPDIDLIPPVIDRRQFGGPASGLTLVGEAGPELVNLPGGSNVIPNNRIGGGLTWVQNAPIFTMLDFEDDILRIVARGIETGALPGRLLR